MGLVVSEEKMFENVDGLRTMESLDYYWLTHESLAKVSLKGKL